MATFAKKCLSPGGTENNGLPILMATTSTNIHQTTTTTTTYDEIWLYAHNYDTTARKLTIEFGGTNDKDDIEMTIPAESGLVLVVPGLVLRSGGSALSVTGLAATATSIAVSGYVNRITA
jgi:hypothetical protein